MDQKQKQLEKAVSMHFKSKLADSWNKYQVLCKRERVPIKLFLTDVTLYDHVKNIKADDVLDLITKELYDLKLLAASKEKEDPEERAAKRRKLEEDNSKKRGITCDKCNGHRILYIYAHSNDSNDLIFPTGFSYQGYFPRLDGIGCSDAISMDLCVDCGHVVGFNRDSVLAELERVEANPDAVDD